MERIRLSQSHIDLMLRKSISALPREACGVIAGRQGSVSRVLTAVNVAGMLHNFAIDPEELRKMLEEMQSRGEQWLGIWHSHPRSPAIPSAADIKSARHPHLVWLIVSLIPGNEAVASRGISCDGGSVRGYRIDSKRGRFREICVELAPEYW
ncbi:MAG: M67 family metallopeptidase [Bacillota bacterium]